MFITSMFQPATYTAAISLIGNAVCGGALYNFLANPWVLTLLAGPILAPFLLVPFFQYTLENTRLRIENLVELGVLNDSVKCKKTGDIVPMIDHFSKWLSEVQEKLSMNLGNELGKGIMRTLFIATLWSCLPQLLLINKVFLFFSCTILFDSMVHYINIAQLDSLRTFFSNLFVCFSIAPSVAPALVGATLGAGLIGLTVGLCVEQGDFKESIKYADYAMGTVNNPFRYNGIVDGKILEFVDRIRGGRESSQPSSLDHSFA